MSMAETSAAGWPQAINVIVAENISLAGINKYLM